MKRKYIIIVGLILAIMTIGAVSASEDVASDDISASDEGADIEEVSLDEAPQTDEIIESENDDSLGSTEVNQIGDPDGRMNSTHRVEIPEDIRIGKDSWDEDIRYDYVAAVFSDYDIGGTVSIWIDNEERYNSTVIPGSYGGYDANYFKVSDIGLTAGIHNVTVKYSGDENYLPFEENGSFELYYMKASVPENVLVGGYSYEMFTLIFSMNATGNVAVYIDNNKKVIYDVYEARLSEEGLESNIYVDLYELGCTFGPHTYKIEYYGGNYDDKNVSGSFNLDYVFNVDVFEAIYGSPIEFIFNMPNDALSNITLAINGKTYLVESEGYYFGYYYSGEVQIGENKFTFTYEDSKYPKKTVNVTVNVSAKINFKQEFSESYLYNSNDHNVTLALPSDANGNLSIYKYENYENKYILIANVPLQDGKASVSILNIGLGPFNLIANYTGDDYDVNQLEIWITIEPNVHPNGVWIDSVNDTEIIVEVPQMDNDTLIIEISRYNEEQGGYTSIGEVFTGSFKTQNFTLPSNLDLKVGSYLFNVIRVYGEEEWEREEWQCRFYIHELSPNLDAEVMVPEEVSKLSDEYYEGHGYTSEYRFFPSNVPKDFNGILSLYIDGKRKDWRYYDDDGEFEYDLTSLSIGTHTWEVTLTDDSYYNDLSLNGSFEVVWYKMPATVKIGADYISLDFGDDATGYVSLKIDNEDYAMEFLEDGYVKIMLDGLSEGSHTYEIAYSGDANHEKFNKSGSFNAVVNFYFDNLDYDDFYSYSNPFIIEIRISDDATGNITINVDGTTNYTQKIVGGAVKFEIPLGIGKHTVVAKYLGDDKYRPCEISTIFEITGYRIQYDFGDGDEIESVSLGLPSNATGNLTIRSCYWDDDYGYQLGELIASIPLVNGNAYYSFKDNLRVESGMICVYYDGDDYEVEKMYLDDFFKGPIVEVSDSLVMGENGTVEINVGNATGNIIIYINNEEFKTVEIVNGKINVTIPAAKFNLDNNIITFKYSGDDLSEYIFGYYDDEFGEYYPDEYNVYVGPLNFGIPSEFSSDGSENITIELPEGSRGNITVYVNGVNVSTTPVTAGVNEIPVSGLEQGYATVMAEYVDDNGQSCALSQEVYVPKPNPETDITTPADSETPEFTVNLSDDATGSLIVSVNGKNYERELENGKATISVPGLADGTYEVMVKYSGDGKYSGFTKYVNVTIKTQKEPVEPNFNILPIGDVEQGKEVTIYITANETFSGTVNVQIGTMNATAILTNGQGNITVPTDFLDVGETLVKVTSRANENFTAGEFSIKFNITSKGDDGSNSSGNDTNVSVPAKIVAKDLVAYYNKVSYYVTVYGTDGKVAKGVLVTFKINGKNVGTAKTNAKGVAVIKLSQLPKTYKITSSALGKSVTKKLTVKRVLALNKVKIKKSTKKLTIKATLKEGKKAINGKITFKIKGKKVKIKKTVTTKKGVAKLTLKKSVVKKLKKGKKVKYQATYIKDTIKKTVKVKK